ncbi:hypothetical protein BZA05DRAFT_413003 [Tricharina praecox]|uniref:uncharacterized protein n=1 Tax=Tricharina praecox TaxID=43433 RepID=UPI002220DBE4|nr:uncharacterized protein BZA05DRAFT_413003 [Tricharina praecox]KAI5841651.1 hypothetical protein BZA05DRAFT_413003 [Tricharina praecox]
MMTWRSSSAASSGFRGEYFADARNHLPYALGNPSTPQQRCSLSTLAQRTTQTTSATSKIGPPPRLAIPPGPTPLSVNGRRPAPHPQRKLHRLRRLLRRHRLRVRHLQGPPHRGPRVHPGGLHIRQNMRRFGVASVRRLRVHVYLPLDGDSGPAGVGSCGRRSKLHTLRGGARVPPACVDNCGLHLVGCSLVARDYRRQHRCRKCHPISAGARGASTFSFDGRLVFLWDRHKLSGLGCPYVEIGRGPMGVDGGKSSIFSGL